MTVHCEVPETNAINLASAFESRYQRQHDGGGN